MIRLAYAKEYLIHATMCVFMKCGTLTYQNSHKTYDIRHWRANPRFGKIVIVGRTGASGGAHRDEIAAPDEESASMLSLPPESFRATLLG